MRTYIWWIFGSLFGVFALLFLLVGIPVIQHMHNPIDPPDVFLRQTAAGAPISDECRQKRSEAAKLIEPLATARNAVNDEQSKMTKWIAMVQPLNTPEPVDKYLSKSEKEKYDVLSDQYLHLSNQIEAIQAKYACT